VSTILPRLRLRNARAWAPRTRKRWLIAVAAFLSAVLTRLALHKVLGHHAPLLFFSIAALVAHFFFGLWPGILVAVAGLPTGIILFVPPFFAADGLDGQDMIRVATFAGYTIVYMVLVQYLRRAQYQSVLLAEVAQSRYLMLLDSESDRAAAEAELEAREH